MDLPVGGVRKSERPTERLCALWPVSSYGWGVYFCMHIWLQVLICVYASAGACHQAALRHQIWSLQMLTSAACHFIKIDEWRGEKEEKEREKRCRWEKRQSWMAGGNGRGHGGVMEESVNQTTFCCFLTVVLLPYSESCTSVNILSKSKNHLRQVKLEGETLE